jgi:hypothetical protein
MTRRSLFAIPAQARKSMIQIYAGFVVLLVRNCVLIMLLLVAIYVMIS